MLEQRDETVVNAFRTGYSAEPAGVWVAPGRVNLIGEHTDYNDGFVMPFALDQRVTLAARPRPDSVWSVTSVNTGRTEVFDADELQPGMAGWQAYIAGVVWALRESGHDVGGADLTLGSDVPLGSGLSSSAALECAALTALVDLNELTIEPLQRAILARKAENEFVGAPTGLMDQAASTLCVEGHALFFDCRDHAIRQVPLADPALEILVLNTNTPHAHVDGEYAARRASCEEAARLLGVPALRDVTDLDAALAKLDDDLLRRRVRHVVTEDARVLEAVAVLEQGRLADLGPLLDASHVSMRDDFEITVPTIDLAVETAREAGALGARMTGGGFGGCIIALVPTGTADAVAGRIGEAFAAAGYAAPAHFVGRPSAGARRIA
ncbi:galactokinase [Microlunatus speluncae]|uniref:galactokinase n=1 Tax=Microlunatus speluncae TaxID=2594267 RepID=UPI001FECED99|nr:galactokinase [Microlunatus speluncae]